MANQFRSTWETSENNEIVYLPQTISNDITVDWGDNTGPLGFTSTDVLHQYDEPGL